MKKITLSALTVVACALSQGVFAHTGVKDTITEGTTSTYNAFTVTHGCASNTAVTGTPQLDVLGSSVVFPNAAGSTVNKVDASGNTIAAIDLGTVINGTVGGAFVNMSPAAIYPSLFDNMKVTFDTASNIRGFYTYGGGTLAGSKAVGLIPFRMAGVTFKADDAGAGTVNCAKSLKVRMAVANWCKRGVANNADPARADIWIGHMTAKFNDPLVMPYSATDVALGKVYWPTLTINRDLVAHPLDASCAGGFDVAIEPTDADIDAYLPIPSTVTPKFWPGK
jgi:hypothetical protein